MHFGDITRAALGLESSPNQGQTDLAVDARRATTAPRIVSPATEMLCAPLARTLAYLARIDASRGPQTTPLDPTRVALVC